MNRKQFIKKLKKIQQKDIETVKKKNADYANTNDPFQNFRMVENTGLCTLEKGILVRITDKIQRITNILGNKNRQTQVKDETITDTLSDLRNYATILQAYIEQKTELKKNLETTTTKYYPNNNK